MADINSLKARVAALGHILVERPSIDAETDEHTDPGLYVVDVAGGRFAVTPTGHGRKDDLDEIEGWCDERETPKVVFGEPPKGFETAAQWLTELEARSAQMDLGAIVDQLKRGLYDVMLNIDAGENEDEYRVAHGWTEKGVRHAWAELQLIGAIRGYTDVIRPDSANANGGMSAADAWRAGADLAIELIEEADDVGLDEMALESDCRDGRPQKNLVLHYLNKLRELNSPQADAAFGAVLSDFIATWSHSWFSREHVEQLTRKPIATSPEGGAA